MEKINEYFKWQYVRIAGIVLGVIGAILLVQFLMLYMKINSLMSGNFAASLSAISMLNDIANLLNLNFLGLIIIAPCMFVKARFNNVNYLPAKLFVGVLAAFVVLQFLGGSLTSFAGIKSVGILALFVLGLEAYAGFLSFKIAVVKE